MSIEWAQPGAAFGLLALVVPIVVHLLARDRSRRYLFPSLRFLPVSRTAALRTRVVSDWPLLAIRCAVIAAAVAALAGPILISALRRDAWDARVIKAIVVVGPADEGAQPLVADESATAAGSRVFSELPPADALRAAGDWLRDQPPARREIVVVGSVTEGALTARDVEQVAPAVGVRFLPLPADAAAPVVTTRAISDAAGRTQASDIEIAVALDRTVARHEPAVVADDVPLRVEAPAGDQARAEALLRAVLAEGLVLGRARDRRVTIAFPEVALADVAAGAPPSQDWMRNALSAVPGATGRVTDGRVVVRLPVPAADPRAAEMVSRVAVAAFGDPLDDVEPRRVSAATLAAWSRPSGPPAAEAQPGEGGERRWLWGLVLLLLALESVVRRSPGRSATSASPAGSRPEDGEVRVA